MTLLSKNKVKYLSSLKLKKFRDENRQFLVEGDKIIRDLLAAKNNDVLLLSATAGWLEQNGMLCSYLAEVYEATEIDMQRISSFETPPKVIVLMRMNEHLPDFSIIQNSLSLALDTIQDPGNLGTIIRTADWFNVGTIFCNRGCADVYNPKVIQASMGAMFNVNLHYVEFGELFRNLSAYQDFIIAGTFMSGEPVSAIKGIKRGIIVFGNESKGISADVSGFVNRKITIPAPQHGRRHVESLNVASAVAAILSVTSDFN